MSTQALTLFHQWKVYVHYGRDEQKVIDLRSLVIEDLKKFHPLLFTVYDKGRTIWKRIQSKGKRSHRFVSIMFVAPEDTNSTSTAGKFIQDTEGDPFYFFYITNRPC